jgi:hypothetical protein
MVVCVHVNLEFRGLCGGTYVTRYVHTRCSAVLGGRARLVVLVN